jgi:hypothetical protein
MERSDFYVTAVDHLIQRPGNEPTAGLLYQSKNKAVVEYALNKLCKPIGVATFQLNPSFLTYYKRAYPRSNNWSYNLPRL